MTLDDAAIREWRAPQAVWRRIVAGFLLSVTFLIIAAPVASAETRTLKLYFLHTRERAEITYKRNGRYIQSGLNEVNRFLRDWRRNEPTKMDPRLLDLLWQVYQATGARDYIHVISAYRAPETNAMLRKRSSGVAKKSQHTLGKAIDFYIPDVKLSKLRAVGLKMQVGGVGYYPRSGSPFVHLDVGSVRHWPRMSRGELLALFPDGKTLHVPTDGKPLPGYERALASYKSRVDSDSIQVAGGYDTGGGGGGSNRLPGARLVAALFGGGADDEEDSAQAASPPPRAVAQASTSAPRQPEPARAEPEPAETPATILAALPARDVPRPNFAPRPKVGIGTATAGETPADTAPGETPAIPAAPEEDSPFALAALDAPLPSSRPEIAQGDGGDVVAFAEEHRGADAIAEVLKAKDRGLGVAASAYVPIPGDRPTTEAQPEYTLAALPDEAPAQKAGRPVSASQRLALLGSDPGTEPGRAIAVGVRTTAKSARPGRDDLRPGPKPVVVPVQPDRARWVLSSEPVKANTQGTRAPSFGSAFVQAPREVYTTGFRQVAAVDSSRFSGSAVTFLSVAKFDTN